MAVQPYLNSLPATTLNNEDRVPNPVVISGMNVYYRNLAYPSTGTILLGINYYDTYPPEAPAIPATVLGQYTLGQATGADNDASTNSLPTASYVRNIEDNKWTKNYTYYHTMGRVVFTHSINHLGGYTKTETELDFAGVPQKANTYHLRKSGEVGITVQERFVYDSQNRLKQHFHQVDANPEELLTENTYNELSQLSNKKVGNNLQSIDYAYNIRGWLTDINKADMTVSNLNGKLFAYTIKYTGKDGITNPDSVLFSGKNVTAKYNGNIAEVDWRAVETLGQNPSLTPKRYGYAYDPLNRLRAGYYQNPANPNSKENTESIDYDVNGNITNLFRTSVVESGTTATMIDKLEYVYASGNKSNKLTNINDYAYNPTGYEGGGQEIKYDLNGNMTLMPDKGISKIAYNYLNLPDQLNYAKGIETVTVNTKYGSDGSKLQKQNTTTVDGSIVKKTTDYLDGFQYLKTENIGIIGMSAETMANLETSRALEMQAFSVEPMATIVALASKTRDLQFFPTEEGFYDYQKNQYIYQYKDHLGNVRVSFGRNSAGALEITDANDYYPFGMNHLKTGNTLFGSGTYKNYKFQEQELQETGFYSFKWRNYMPDVGRFFNIDPLAESFPYNSTYAFAENRVIDGRELEGLEWVASRNLEGKTVNLHLTYKPVNNTVGVLSNAQMSTLNQERNAQIVSSFGGKDSEGNQVNITFSESDKATIIRDYNIGYDTNNVNDFKGKSQEFIDNAVVRTDGMADNSNNTQTNRTQINVYTTQGMPMDASGNLLFDKRDSKELAKTGAHEDLHTAGQKHDSKATLASSPDNLMRVGGPGTKMTPEQRTESIKLIEQQQQQPKTR